MSQKPPACNDFLHGAKKALDDEGLQAQLARSLKDGFQQKRQKAKERPPEYDEPRPTDARH